MTCVLFGYGMMPHQAGNWYAASQDLACAGYPRSKRKLDKLSCVMELIVEGKPTSTARGALPRAKQPARTNVVDLMAALKKSLG